MSSCNIPILTYHSLDDSRSVISTSPSTFKKQMEFMWENGYQTLSLTTVVELMHLKEPFPEKKFAVTFDDGYQNNYIEAFPIMQEFGFKGTIFFMAGGDVNRNGSGQLSSFENRPLLSWSEINEMHKYGFEFGAHTLTHPDLTQIPLTQAEHEIVQSKEAIQDHLGVKVKTFAYPYGKYNGNVIKIVRNHFEGACSTKLGKIEINNDPHALKRIDMYYLQRDKFFRILTSNTMDWYLRMRHILRESKAFFL
jgi:peptidoglycan/xylan/chitin deacetylase (PgdA/CDA1 family)